LKKNNNHLEVLLKEQEQYSCRNCLLIHDIPVGSNEDTNQIALDTFQTNLGLAITANDVDRSHKLGNSSGPIIAKFVKYNARKLIYSYKKSWKGTGITITETLTVKRKACM